jgi:hypothetical protein
VAGLRRPRRRSSAARPKAAGYSPLLSFFSVLSLPPPFPSPQKPRGQGVCRPWRTGGDDGGAAAGPLAGARAPLRVSAPPSSGSAVVPDWHGGEARGPCTPLSARVRAQGGTGGGGDGKVGALVPFPASFAILDLGLGLGFGL